MRFIGLILLVCTLLVGCGDDAKALIKDVPLPANISNSVITADRYVFQSEQSSQEIADFYTKEMKKNDWNLVNQTAAADSFVLEYNKDSRTIRITIAPLNNGSTVAIDEE